MCACACVMQPVCPQVGKTSDKAYKNCFAAYMSMSCASAFPRCAAVFALFAWLFVGLGASLPQVPCQTQGFAAVLLIVLLCVLRLWRGGPSGRCVASRRACAIVFAPVFAAARCVRLFFATACVGVCENCFGCAGARAFGLTTSLGESSPDVLLRGLRECSASYFLPCHGQVLPVRFRTSRVHARCACISALVFRVSPVAVLSDSCLQRISGIFGVCRPRYSCRLARLRLAFVFAGASQFSAYDDAHPFSEVLRLFLTLSFGFASRGLAPCMCCAALPQAGLQGQRWCGRPCSESPLRFAP